MCTGYTQHVRRPDRGRGHGRSRTRAATGPTTSPTPAPAGADVSATWQDDGRARGAARVLVRRLERARRRPRGRHGAARRFPWATRSSGGRGTRCRSTCSCRATRLVGVRCGLPDEVARSTSSPTTAPFGGLFHAAGFARRRRRRECQARAVRAKSSRESTTCSTGRTKARSAIRPGAGRSPSGSALAAGR